jgi:ankyrin repeat protein
MCVYLLKDGRTPLHFAAFNGHKKVVELLLERGANIDARNKSMVMRLLLYMTYTI